MATMDDSKLTSRKLKNMLNTELSDEARQAIENELQKRESATAAAQSAESQQGYQAPDDEAGELSPEEQAAIEAAEAEYNKEQKEGRKTLLSLSPDEIEARKNEMAANVGHKCKVLPNGEIEWAEGVVVAVTHDKRSNAIMYTVRLSDGKKVRKAYGAKTLIVSEEIVEITKSAGRTVVEGSRGAGRSLSEAEDLREKAQEHRGHYALLPVGDEKVKGYVTGIMLDKRSNAVLFAFAL